MPLNKLTAEWLVSQRATSTRRQYARAIQSFFDWVSVDKAYTIDDFRKIDRKLCEAWYRELTKRYGEQRENGEWINTTQTAMVRFTAFSSWLSFATDRGVLSHNPARGILKKQRCTGTPRRALKLEQAQGFALTGCKLQWGRHPDSPQAKNGDVFRMISIVLLATGCRRAELCSLKVRHFDPGPPPKLTFLGKGNKVNRVTLADDTAKAIASHIAKNRLTAEDQICWVPGANRLKTDTIGWMMKRVSRHYGTKMTAHQFRSTLATELHLSGIHLVELQRFLGHANPQTTANYIHLAEENRSAPGRVVETVPKALVNS